MLSEKTTPLQTQYVIGRDDLADVINEIVDARMQRFYDEKKKEAEADQLIKPKEAAEQLDVNLTTLWRWHNEGYLKKVYVGSKPRYKQSDIDRIKQKGVQQ
ncbi:MAG: helix-turn-helix domain-containing protein [Bacteroidales bacterium]|nr:helix-turn-helix domain-containing protein [Bacteroidales bacterium]